MTDAPAQKSLGGDHETHGCEALPVQGEGGGENPEK